MNEFMSAGLSRNPRGKRRAMVRGVRLDAGKVLAKRRNFDGQGENGRREDGHRVVFPLPLVVEILR